MSIEQAVVTDVVDETPPYLWSDLLARRDALGLGREEMARVLSVDQRSYQAREWGALSVGRTVIEEVAAMESFVDDETDRLLRRAPKSGGVVLRAALDQREFERKHPQARSVHGDTPYPVTLQHVATGRAAAILDRQDRTVAVLRGDKWADLLVRRLAVGLVKRETPALLGVSESHYYKCERGNDPAPTGLVSELQVIDDFIQLSGLLLKRSRIEGATVVHMLDDADEFLRAFPRARTLMGFRPYPLRVHRIAAARRAQRLAAEGARTRIVVTSYPSTK